MNMIHGKTVKEASDILGVSRQIVSQVAAGKKREPADWKGKLDVGGGMKGGRLGIIKVDAGPVVTIETSDGVRPTRNTAAPSKEAVRGTQSRETVILKSPDGAAKQLDHRVILKSPDGNKAFDIMEDGYARGFAGDSLTMRQYYRTAGSLRRILEEKHGVHSFPGMALLPTVYQINSQGVPCDCKSGEVLKFDGKPGVSHTSPK